MPSAEIAEASRMAAPADPGAPGSLTTTADITAEVVAAVHRGSPQAWAQLCRHQAPRLAGYLGARLRRPLVVESVVGETLVAAWARRSEIPLPPETDSWFRRQAAGQARKWRAAHPDEALSESFPAGRCADPAQVGRMRLLDECLGRLGEADRLAVEQHWRGGLTGMALAVALHLRTPAEAEAQIENALGLLESAHEKAADGAGAAAAHPLRQPPLDPGR